jgi:hypothetical protein
MTHNGNNLAYRAYLRNHGYGAAAIDDKLWNRNRCKHAVAVEGYFAKRSVYPASIEEAEAFGFHPTSGVTVL